MNKPLNKFKNTEEAEEFLRRPSKKQIDLLIESITTGSKTLEMVYSIAVSDKNPAAWRASWVLVHIDKQKPQLLNSYEDKMIDDYNRMPTDRQKASILQILTHRNFSIAQTGNLFDAALYNLIAAGKPMYFRMYSLIFLEHFVSMVPELAPEVLAVIEGENNLPSNHSIKLAVNRIRKNLIQNNR